jgi:hypothetical protein
MVALLLSVQIAIACNTALVVVAAENASNRTFALEHCVARLCDSKTVMDARRWTDCLFELGGTTFLQSLTTRDNDTLALYGAWTQSQRDGNLQWFGFDGGGADRFIGFVEYCERSRILASGDAGGIFSSMF